MEKFKIQVKTKTPLFTHEVHMLSLSFMLIGLLLITEESYGIFAACGILFNHESPLRGEEFVTKKITLAVAKIKHGLQKTLYLGNLNARRDWGYAKDYVQGMWQILQAEKPDNYVLATGKNETIRNFAVLAFRTADIEIEFEGEKENEIGIDIKTGNPVIRIDKKHYRPAEVDTLLGNPKRQMTS